MHSQKLRHPAVIALGLGILALVIAAPPSISVSTSVETTLDGIGPQLLAQQQQPRTALIIGNAAYQENWLANPVNDANDVAAALRSLGFEVTLLLDKDLRAMEDALNAFNRQLQRGGVGVFYYAGHGVQVDGENYLIPLNARLDRQNDVRYETLPLGRVLNAMEDSSAQVKVVMIDACRDNPFYRRWRSGNRTLSAQRGLAFEAPPEGTIISFATGPNNVAADGKGRNSPYTASLLQHINTPNADINAIFRAVRADVMNVTSGRQVPWYQESLVGSFSFNSEATTAIAPVPQPTPQVQQPRPVTRPSPPPSAPQATLISSATGANYQHLRDVLAAGDFRRADDATLRVMTTVAGSAPGALFSEDMRNFPCEDLNIIDQLWLDHSNGKFGFSVQQQIYQSLGGTIGQYDRVIYQRFWQQVGVLSNGVYMYDQLYDETALAGSLPFYISTSVFGGFFRLPAVESCRV